MTTLERIIPQHFRNSLTDMRFVCSQFACDTISSFTWSIYRAAMYALRRYINVQGGSPSPLALAVRCIGKPEI